MPGKKSESALRKMVDVQAKGKGAKRAQESERTKKGASELDERASKAKLADKW